MGGRYTEILELRRRGEHHTYDRGTAATSLADVTRGVVRVCDTESDDDGESGGGGAESLWYCQKMCMYKKVFQRHRARQGESGSPELLWSCALPRMDAVVTQCSSASGDGPPEFKLWGLADGQGWATFVPPETNPDGLQGDHTDVGGRNSSRGEDAFFARMRPVPVAGGRALLCGTATGTLALYSAARPAGSDQEEYVTLTLLGKQ